MTHKNMQFNDLSNLNMSYDRVNDPWQLGFIIGYMILFILIISSNVIAIVAGYRRFKKCKNLTLNLRKRSSELTRCMLLIYLSILDILLCLTIPMVAISLLSMTSPFENLSIDWMCHYTKFFPALAINAMSMWIILIAVDSYQNICRPLNMQFTPTSTVYIFILIIVIASLIASPLFFATQIIVIPTNIKLASNMQESTSGETNASIFDTNGESDEDHTTIRTSDISICVENWNFSLTRNLLNDKSGRLLYSIFTLIIQYLIPFLTISILHTLVIVELRLQGERRRGLILEISKNSQYVNDTSRLKRNVILLTTMSLVFCFCWLPQNLIYIALDQFHDLLGYDPRTTVKLCVICHWIGMVSTCANPIIYGFFNNTIRQGINMKTFL